MSTTLNNIISLNLSRQTPVGGCVYRHSCLLPLVDTPIAPMYAGVSRLKQKIWTNEKAVMRSHDQYWPIRGQYWGHMTIIDQSEASIEVTWPLLTNQRPVLRSHDQYLSMRDQYPRHMTIIDQSEAIIQVTWPVLTNERSVLKSHEQYWPIRGQHSPVPGGWGRGPWRCLGAGRRGSEPAPGPPLSWCYSGGSVSCTWRQNMLLDLHRSTSRS